MLGKAKAETLQDIIPWLIGSLTPEEQLVFMSLLRRVTKNTMFDEWLGEWWEGHDTAHVAPESNTLWTADPLEIISRYLSTDALEEQGDILCDKGIKLDCFGANIDMLGKCNLDDNAKVSKGNQNNEGSKSEKLVSEIENKTCNEVAGVTIKVDKPGQPFQSNPKSGHHEHLLTTSQDDLEAAIRRVSRDSSLDPEKKSYIIQNLLMRLILAFLLN
ncbi:hypothetical protein P3X46_023313 [Hevea brasiliensis]|uniref:Uncharacterized protein n=1 Tax=Hevea brasiliensis TaxID=3981 RepID=A0ABQ9LAJ6_HEVBR|nr:hypothetical protein P3X46_023313 [Hevea brasiliensis]